MGMQFRLQGRGEEPLAVFRAEHKVNQEAG
jgi:hypothetical protein